MGDLSELVGNSFAVAAALWAGLTRTESSQAWQGICRSSSHIISYFGNLGPDIAYLYPDLSTALVGNFKSGDLVTGQVSSLISVRLDYGAIQVVMLKKAPMK